MTPTTAFPRPGARRIVVSGSIAFDYLMTFPGKFVDVVVPDRMHRLSVSFLVDAMRKVRGGVAPNIAYTLALLGADAAILGAAGADAREYRAWLAEQSVDVSGFAIFEDLFTASFFVSTDLDQNQIATFYAGAMARAASLSLTLFDPGSLAGVVVAPDDPAAMAAHARECRTLRIPFVYDPSQQVARLTGEEILAGLDGAAVLIGNEYEFGVIEKKTGLSEAELLARVPVVVVTRGAEGSTIALREGIDGKDGATALRIPAAKLQGPPIDPTGVGDAFRGGLFAALLKGLPWAVAARVGSVAAAFALETLGPQPRSYEVAELRARYEESFGPEPALAHLRK